MISQSKTFKQNMLKHNCMVLNYERLFCKSNPIFFNFIELHSTSKVTDFNARPQFPEVKENNVTSSDVYNHLNLRAQCLNMSLYHSGTADTCRDPLPCSRGNRLPPPIRMRKVFTLAGINLIRLVKTTKRGLEELLNIALK